ncbi:hypothetical protein O181_072870 [Austropuccinia psidii MF-1]|uniref:Integrase catalytic domain-containing protein n=1 Tax=Austropuccinia psidii MF-1 TaxID=1389203 RepID=A0A9Q3IBF4_9BASI|nr:hypothetical protein [Austropuccinia psidii MF-1]
MSVRNKNTSPRPSIAPIGAVPALENNEMLLDSGATHSVVGDLSLFIDSKSTSMKLSVASSEQFDVGVIGSIKLNTMFGPMIVKNVLYCAKFPGIVLSIGQLINQGFNVEFDYGIFTQEMGGKRNYRLFVALDMANKDVNIRPILVNEIPPSINFSTRPGYNHEKDCSYLWHQRMGHLSIRNIKRLLKFNAVEGLHINTLNDVGICHPCSIAKSEHRTVQSPSQKNILTTGDMILEDLIGPLPLSLDKKRYALVIQDSFSRLTAIIPLQDKTEARTHLKTWMIQFMNTMKVTIKGVRTDNGAEFKNNALEEFLKEKELFMSTLCLMSITKTEKSNKQIELYQKSQEPVSSPRAYLQRYGRGLLNMRHGFSTEHYMPMTRRHHMKSYQAQSHH